MALEHSRILLVFAVMVGMVSTVPVFGQEPFPVFVEFDFGAVSPLKNNPTATEIEFKVAERMVACFTQAAHQEFFPWKVQAGRAINFPKIKVILIEDPKMTRWELRIEAYKENGALADRLLPLQRIVSEPGDLELRRGRKRTPRSSEFPAKASEWLASRFLQPDSRQELQRLMMAVAPLGDCRVLAQQGTPKGVEEAEGVLELDWKKFWHLSRSVFTVVCEANDKSRVELGSEGGEKPREYELLGRRGLGIALKHKTWNSKKISDFLPNLDQLSTGRVYLEEFKGLRGMPPFAGMRVTDR